MNRRIYVDSSIIELVRTASKRVIQRHVPSLGSWTGAQEHSTQTLQWFEDSAVADPLEEDYSLAAKGTLYRCLDRFLPHQSARIVPSPEARIIFREEHTRGRVPSPEIQRHGSGKATAARLGLFRDGRNGNGRRRGGCGWGSLQNPADEFFQTPSDQVPGDFNRLLNEFGMKV